MKKVFVSGCYDILHAGHLNFFKDAKALGNYLIVCFAGDKSLMKHKNRQPSIPQDHKFQLIKSIGIVDEVVVGENEDEEGLDFIDNIKLIKPQILAVTEDDKYKEKKAKVCADLGIAYVILPKTSPDLSKHSTSTIIQRIKAPDRVPLRVDFAGGWLDVPKFQIENSFIVNCAISPTVSLQKWNYETRSGLGGSGAWAILNGKCGVKSELELGCGWQDPAVIKETGLCVWRSGSFPVLELKMNGDFLKGLMALKYSGKNHDTPKNTNNARDFFLIKRAGKLAYDGVIKKDLNLIAKSINMSYAAQIGEGMEPLEEFEKAIAKKYCGGGWGGYCLYLFSRESDRDAFVSLESSNLAIEPFIENKFLD